ncbi:putative helicase with zinc finger, partial [Stegodyphus mimosarum]
MDNFCTYCSVIVGSEAELRAHCNSEGHQLTIMSDEGREWKFRAPPRGVGADQYALCVSYSATGKCRFGQQCCDAHGEEELTEWRERFDYRQMKLQRAKECRLQGRNYTEQLLEKWLTSSNPNMIMTESLDTVDIRVEPEVSLTLTEKNICREWTFHISAKATLQHIALLYETHRNHFRISELRAGRSSGIKDFNIGPQCQEWSNVDNSDYSDEEYTCKVRFATCIYGTFRQAVVFDFGFEPVLVQKLCVDVVSLSNMEKLQQAKDTAVSFTERWSSSDVTVVPFENRPYSLGDQEECLLSCYPAPNGAKFTVTQSVLEPVLTKNNYTARQHELLCIEEMAQYELLSRYNVKAHLNLTSCYLLTPNSAVTAKYAHDGELFANMQLSSVLSEDSASGRLVLTNCSTVLLAPVKTKGEEQRKVYEAVIEDKGKTAIYIRLSKRCCEELKLEPDREILVEVQFQLNRLPLCEMHFAVDRLHLPSIVFPDISVTPKIWNTNMHENFNLEPRLNPKQKEAILAITTPLSIRLPPVLIIGPFGTGKTFTLAQAVKIILSDPQSRVLVCTHSNSAADIYIREYFHPQVAEGKLEATPLRIYYRHRWVATVHPTVQQYCLVSTAGSDRNFNMPNVDDVKKHRVIVTTLSTSRYLVQLGLEKGFFTHILIDEAAQAMECEAIMPLSLANENTRIVLAGDHMQLSPEVYSQFAQQRNLHTSLLERLYDLYPEDYPCKVLLCENYRSHEAIIQYTSELFYDNHLLASGQQPRHKKYYPLTFFTARGEDVQDCNSTAFHNNAEVYEIVERVIELKKKWPKSWGEQDETSIGVVTPYYDQVVRIRNELRKKKLHGVSVERVLNVQGKQFRVIFLSTVRTRQTCSQKAKLESDLDHGFLSNARLLNTAITRAQSLVAVVGDPVSLCSVGKCRKLWEKYILTCNKEKSLFGITWDSLRSELDSMELKKNFILNPLAPEFVPGRMYHAPDAPASTDTVCTDTPIQFPFYFLPFGSPFQGSPLIQPAIAHMMSAPNPYNVVSCICPSIMPPTQPNPFQNHTFNTPPLLPPPPPLQQQQHSTNIPNRVTPAILNRKVSNNRGNSVHLDHNGQVKDFELGIGRQTKRNEIHVPYVVNKQPSYRPFDEHSHNEIDDVKCAVPNRVEPFNNFNISNDVDSNVHFQNNQSLYNFEEKANKPVNMLKAEEMVNIFMKNSLPGNQLNNINAFTKNGLPGNQLNSVPLFSDHMSLRNKIPPVNGVWCPFPSKSVDSESHSAPHSRNEESMKCCFRHGFSNERERARNAITSVPTVHPLMSSNNAPSAFEKWSDMSESMPNANNIEVVELSRSPIFQQLQEKLNLLEKVLPAGVDVLSFVENEEQTLAFLQHLIQSAGRNAARTLSLLIKAIKRDQEIIQELDFSQKRHISQRFNASQVPHVSTSMIRNLPSSFSRPINAHHQEVFNNSESFTNDSSVSPFPMPCIINSDKIEPRFFNNEHDQDLQRPQMSNLQTNWMNSSQDNIGTYDRIILNRASQEPPALEMSKLFISNQLENRPDHLARDDIFPHEAFGNRHRIEVDRMDEKHMWISPEYKLSQNIEQTGSPFQFAEPINSQGSYLSRLRSISSSVDERENGYEFEFSRANDQSSSKNIDSAKQMTAGPLSMSYPDIPDILSSHILPNGKESSSKVIRKPTARSESSVVNSSPFKFDLPLQLNNDSSLQYPQLSSEGMTYAKIVRSPQQ